MFKESLLNSTQTYYIQFDKTKISKDYLPKFVEKRDGSFVTFDFEKIHNAIIKAVEYYLKTNKTKLTQDIIDKIYQAENYIQSSLIELDTDTVHIEEIQNIVIESLKQASLSVVAFCYSNYRNMKAKERQIFNDRVIKIIDSYLKKHTWEVNENANMGYSVQGLNLYLFSTMNKIYWKEVVFKEKLSKYHDNGDFHIHDLYLLAPYCVGWDLKALLERGFGGVKGKLQCTPPKHFDSACGQIVNFLYTLQGEAAGAVAFSNVDTYLAPFIIRDGLHKDRQHMLQIIQKFLYNLSVDTRVGFQCVSEDTEILTENGWKTYDQITMNDRIYTFNLDTNSIELLPLEGLNIYHYNGTMCRFYGDDRDELVTPTHKCVVKDRATKDYTLNDAEDILMTANSYISLVANVTENNGTYDIDWNESTVYNLAYELNYNGIVWCPTTKNGTIIARRNGKTFITGNSPFTNITLDLECPEHMKNESIIIGGKYLDDVYGNYQEGLDTFNDAFCTIMMNGDKDNKIFTFPIPTYCIDENFDWSNPKLEKLWIMTGKYGIPYFGNYINTGFSKEESRSMCPIHGDEYVLYYDKLNDQYKFNMIKHLKNNGIYHIYSDGKFVKGKFQIHPNQHMLKITLDNGHTLTISKSHLNYILENKNSKKISELTGDELKVGMYLPYTIKFYRDSNTHNYNLGVNIGKIIFHDDIIQVHSNSSINSKLFLLMYDEKIRIDVFKTLSILSGNGCNKIYTKNKELICFLNLLATMSNMYTTVSKNNNEYELTFDFIDNLEENKPFDYVMFDDKMWVKITNIEYIGIEDGYCFEVIDDEPMFTVGSTGILTHNCRLRLDLSELQKKHGGLFGASSLTGSIGVVTINLSRIGHLAKDKKEFIDRLDKLVEEAHRVLRKKAEFVEKQTELGLYPYSKYFLQDMKFKLGRYWANHFLTIGIVAMHEACLNLFEEGIDSEVGHEFAIEVMKFLNQKCLYLQQKYGYLTNLEASPAEGVSYRLCQKDKELYPDMNTFKIEDKIFYTNSTQLPVNTDKDLWEALQHQEPLQIQYTGGTVFHGFLGESINDPIVVRNLIKRVLENYKIPYFNLTPTFSICEDHGYIKGNVSKCPKCGKDTLVYSRVVGYYRPVNQWNVGKQQEFKMRTTFDNSI